MSETPGYTAQQIQVLEGLEGVRRRPAMYIGSTGPDGLHHLLYEVVDNSVDEALAGACTRIDVTLHADGSATVLDNGRGIPVDNIPRIGKPALEVVLTTLHAGGKFGGGGYKISGGLHGVGVSVVNALSEWLEVEVYRGGKTYRQRFARGKPQGPLRAEPGSPQPTGTRVTFRPDPEVMTATEFSFDVIARRLEDIAYLNAGLEIHLVEERSGRRATIKHDGGIKELVVALNRTRTRLSDLIYKKSERDGVEVEVAAQYTDAYVEHMLTYVNTIPTTEGGTHLVGFRSALTRTINEYAKRAGLVKDGDPALTGEDVREGLTAVLSVKMAEPQFEGQTKTKLGNSEVGTFVETCVHEKISLYLEEHPAEARRIVARTVQAALAREAARKARETARKSALSGVGLSRKLVDCSNRNPDETELFIVEGDSAAGSAKGHRDARTQAILPIRGKILNVEKARLHKVLSHEEILEIVKALGTGIGPEEFDTGKLRYGRIILMTDADVDGSHIRTLLLTFFFRHLRPLIERGCVYIAQPPLYQLAKGRKVEYVLDDAALNVRLTRLGLEQTALSIRRPGNDPLALEGERLAALLAVIEEIEQQRRTLERRGIVLQEFVERHMRHGRLPLLRALSDGQEHFFFEESDFELFRREQIARGASVVRHELGESRILLRCFAELTDFGCGMDDLFLRRVEQITGELSPAVFVLEHPQAGALELENLAALPEGVRSIGARGWEIKRFKGLGEMNKEELWQTTMDPANRVLRRVIVGESAADPEQADIDAKEADRIFSILMGEDVEKRKDFLERNAIHAKNLDV